MTMTATMPEPAPAPCGSQVIHSGLLVRLLEDAQVPAGIVVSTIDLGGYPSPDGVYIQTDSLRDYTAAVLALAEAIGDGAALEAYQLDVSASWSAHQLLAHMRGWILNPPLADPDAA